MKYLLLMLLSTSALANDYTSALEHSQQAFLIQSGIQAKITQVQHYATNKATYYVEKTGFSREVGFGLYFYKVYRQKSITIPVVRGKKLTVQPNYVQLSMEL